MTVKSPSQWIAPSGTGYLKSSGSLNIQTQSGKNLLTQAGGTIILNPEVWTPKYLGAWVKTAKNAGQWLKGYVQSPGSKNITDNLGDLLTDNLGNFIVTNPNYELPKNPSLWANTGV